MAKSHINPLIAGAFYNPPSDDGSSFRSFGGRIQVTRAIYRKVIERFGPVRPFVNIVEAEGTCQLFNAVRARTLGIRAGPLARFRADFDTT